MRIVSYFYSWCAKSYIPIIIVMKIFEVITLYKILRDITYINVFNVTHFLNLSTRLSLIFSK